MWPFKKKKPPVGVKEKPSIIRMENININEIENTQTRQFVQHGYWMERMFLSPAERITIEQEIAARSNFIEQGLGKTNGIHEIIDAGVSHRHAMQLFVHQSAGTHKEDMQNFIRNFPVTNQLVQRLKQTVAAVVEPVPFASGSSEIYTVLVSKYQGKENLDVHTDEIKTGAINVHVISAIIPLETDGQERDERLYIQNKDGRIFLRPRVGDMAVLHASQYPHGVKAASTVDLNIQRRTLLVRIAMMRQHTL